MITGAWEQPADLDCSATAIKRICSGAADTFYEVVLYSMPSVILGIFVLVVIMLNLVDIAARMSR